MSLDENHSSAPKRSQHSWAGGGVEGGGGGLDPPPPSKRSPGASIGQVWTRHLAPAAPASRPSLPTQFHDCACHSDSAMLFLSLPSALNGNELGCLYRVLGFVAFWTEFGA